MIGRRHLGMAALVGFALAAVACTGQPVGRICDLGGSRHCVVTATMQVKTDTICAKDTDCMAGETCAPEQPPAPGESVVASPSLDCVTRTCLRVPATNPNPPKNSMPPTGNNGLCTAECSSADDCERVPESPCISGFTCGIPVTVGPFCCKKFCICKDYVQYPPSGQPLPMACDANDPANTCCNLSGRKDNPMYPLCKS